MKKVYNFKVKTKIKKSILIITIYYSLVFIKSIIFGLIISMSFIFLPNFFKSTQPTTNDQIEIQNPYLPSQIEITSIDLNMPIQPAIVTDNDWQIFDNSVSWLKNSGDLNSGNIVLYAHNEKNAFGKIIQMGIGNQITLKNNNIQKKYQVTDIFTATPQDTYLLENSNENILTMYTCSGWFDKDRFFVIAKPVDQQISQ